MNKVVIAFAVLTLFPAAVSASNMGDLQYLFVDLKQQAEITNAICLERDPEASVALSARYKKWIDSNGAELNEIETFRKAVLKSIIDRARAEEKAAVSLQIGQMQTVATPLFQQELEKLSNGAIKAQCRVAFKSPEEKDTRVQKFHRVLRAQLEEMTNEKSACEQAIEARKQGGINACPADCVCPPTQVEQKKRAASLEESMMNGDFVEFENLLDQGVDLDTPKHQNSRAPLLVALDKPEFAPFALALIKRGVSLNPKGIPSGVNVLMLAASNSTPEVIKALLSKQKFDINKRKSQRATALSYAVATGRIDNVRLLLALGADPQEKTSEGRLVVSLIDIARLRGFTEIVKLLEQGQR